MKKSLIITICVVIILTLAIGGYFFSQYSQKATLKKALNLTELPGSLKLLKYSDQGVSSFRAEFYLSVDAGQFNELIMGRKYELAASSKADLVQFATDAPPDSFVPVVLCKWGTEKYRTIVYTNISKTLVYVIWDEN